MTAMLTFLGGVAVGYLYDRWRAARLMRHLAPYAYGAPIAATAPPTMTVCSGGCPDRCSVTDWQEAEA